MQFTYSSDVFVSIREDALNRIAKHVMIQNPALFNYGTDYFRTRPDRLCVPIHNPPPGMDIITVVEALKLPGTDIRLDHCFQITEVEVDFYPSNIDFQLPVQLGKLPKNRFAVKVKVNGGIDFAPPSPINCFSVDLFATFGLEIIENSRRMSAVFFDLEFVNIEPSNLETIGEQLLRMMVQKVLVPKMVFDLDKLVFDIGELAHLRVVPDSGVSPNPLIDENQLMLYLNVETAL